VVAKSINGISLLFLTRLLLGFEVRWFVVKSLEILSRFISTLFVLPLLSTIQSIHCINFLSLASLCVLNMIYIGLLLLCQSPIR
jgi:hypothetical protein